MFVKFIEEMLTLIGGLIVFYFVYIFFTRKDDKTDADTPSMAHTALRELVHRAVDEARKLPGLGDSSTTRTQETTTINEQSYEDLLASAILNKVIEKYQRDKVDDNINNLQEKTRKCRHQRYQIKESVDDVDGISSSELTSCDECTSECSGIKAINLKTLQEPRLSLTIEEQIEEVTTTFTTDEDPRGIKANTLNFRNSRRVPFPEYGMDIVDPSQESSDDSQDEGDQSTPMDHITPVESWEENWLFQKKRIPTQSEPVSMLVPNPSADYRALIGNKDAEDTSDLSEFSAQSDEEEEEEEEEEVDEELIEAINQVPQSSKVDQLPQANKRNDFKIFNDYFSDEILIEDHAKNVLINGQNSSDVSSIETDQLVKKGTILLQGIQKINDVKKKSFDIENISDRKGENVNVSSENKPKTSESMLHSDNEKELISEKNQVDEKLSKEFICANKKMNDKSNHQEHSQVEIQSHEANEDIAKTAVSKNLQDQEDSTQSLSTEILTTSTDVRRCREAKAQSVSQVSEKKIDDEDLELSAPPRPGTIAEREHRKWENAAPIQNNPYSQENIEKRLLERQYSRRSPELSGNSSTLPTSPSPPLQIVLGANRPDVKRFGRDYYINDSKSPTGEQSARPGTSNSSRPTSSLSQNSNSTSSDFEQQEIFEQINTSPDILQNNRETEPIEEILERERKNSKNEINAKLNNQGNFDSIATIFDSKKTFSDDIKRKIRRIDLRAYGFENEFNGSNEDMSKKKEQIVVNKLDLRLYGYDAGLRRTQSNNHLDSRVNNRFSNPFPQRVSEIDIAEKSNLSGNRFGQYNSRPGKYSHTQSTEALNDENNMVFKKFGGMKSAISVPNIARSSNTYAYNANKSLSSESEENDIEPLVVQKINVPRDSERKMNNPISGNYSYESDSQSSRTESTDDLIPKYSTLKEFKYSFESLGGEDTFIEKQLPMPSVRRLAQAFNKPPEPIPVPAPRITKTIRNKERPTTPEIHLVKTPRQMHSLTARSISREFREGLKNIPNNPTSPSINSAIIEHSKVPAGSLEIISSGIDSSDDVGIIKAGKLKNDIQFWEQLQQKS